MRRFIYLGFDNHSQNSSISPCLWCNIEELSQWLQNLPHTYDLDTDYVRTIASEASCAGEQPAANRRHAAPRFLVDSATDDA